MLHASMPPPNITYTMKTRKKLVITRMSNLLNSEEIEEGLVYDMS
jgi:hypothetical protein